MQDGEEPIHFFLFNTDTSPEEIARIINSHAAERDMADDEVPGHAGENQNADEIDNSHERVLDPGEEPTERELPPS